MNQQQQPVNPDQICQQAIQAKLNVYQAKEHFEVAIKGYNDQMDNLINVVQMMKARILELEGEKGKMGPKMSTLLNLETTQSSGG